MGWSLEMWAGAGLRAHLEVTKARRHSGWRQPLCEAMEPRRLLSGSAAALPSDAYLSPGTAEVAKVQALMSNLAGPAFQTFAGELRQLEQTSGVSRAQFVRLADDIEELLGDIDTSDQMTEQVDPQAEAQQFDTIQNLVAQAFVAGSDTKAGWNQLGTELANDLSGVSVPTDAQSLFNQMKVIARAAHVTTAQAQLLTADEQALVSALGSHTQSELGGNLPRNLVGIYYEGQLNQFVHQR